MHIFFSKWHHSKSVLCGNSQNAAKEKDFDRLVLLEGNGFPSARQPKLEDAENQDTFHYKAFDLF